MPLVLVTGASGFIAKHTIHRLLEAGFEVRGTVRDDSEAKIANASFLQKNKSFSLVTADLTVDDGWGDAVRDCDYVIHLASPYPLKSPANREELVPIARDGTIRVVEHALNEPSVKKIVVTSSIVAMQYWRDRPRPIAHLTENSWTDTDWEAVPAYPLSKALAERAVWDLAKSKADEDAAKDRIVVVNPAMVWGPMYDDVISTSSDICRLVMTGGYPLLPAVAYCIVDVRDVAELLVACLTAKNVGGRRLIASADTMSMEEIAQILSKVFPQYTDKISTRVMPHWLLWLAVFFDKSLALPLLDAHTSCVCDTQYVTELTGVKFRSGKEAVCAMAQSLVDHNCI